MIRVNRVYLIAITILFGVLLVYQSMLGKGGVFPDSLRPYSMAALILAIIIDAILFIRNKAGKYLRICITLEAGIAYLFFALTTPGSFLGMAFVGVLGVSVLYYDSTYYLVTMLWCIVVYVAGQIRQLAEETKKSTESITHIVDDLNDNAKTVVNAVGVSLKAADSQNQMIRTAADAFDELSGNMNVLIKNIQEINDRIDNLSTANNQIVENITQLSALSEEVSASAEETNHLTEMNVNYASRIRVSIQKINQTTALLKYV